MSRAVHEKKTPFEGETLQTKGSVILFENTQTPIEGETLRKNCTFFLCIASDLIILEKLKGISKIDPMLRNTINIDPQQ